MKDSLLSRRRGSGMLELVLFLGITAVLLGTAVAVYIATQQSRIRQESFTEVEQAGIQLQKTLTQTIRRAEKILVPPVNETGAVLALQMSLNAEFPTIVGATATGNVLFVQKTSVFHLLNERIQVKNLSFRNIGNGSIVASYDLQTIVPLVQPLEYSRHFDATATLFPDDQYESGGCGTCALPSCVSNQYQWYSCEADVCTLSPTTFGC